MRTRVNVTDRPFCGNNEHIYFSCAVQAKFTLNYITWQFVFIIHYLRVRKWKSAIRGAAYTYLKVQGTQLFSCCWYKCPLQVKWHMCPVCVWQGSQRRSHPWLVPDSGDIRHFSEQSLYSEIREGSIWRYLESTLFLPVTKSCNHEDLFAQQTVTVFRELQLGLPIHHFWLLFSLCFLLLWSQSQPCLLSETQQDPKIARLALLSRSIASNPMILSSLCALRLKAYCSWVLFSTWTAALPIFCTTAGCI